MKLWNFLKERMLTNWHQKICENEAYMTYEELVIFAESFANRMAGLKCCAILCQTEMAASMALLSCIAAGVTALPLSLRYGTQHCNKILSTIDPDGIITDLYGELQFLHISDSTYQEPEIHPALLMCTSGTTGIPKGAMLTEDNVIANVTDIASYFAIDTTDTILIARPLYHCAVLNGEFLTALVKGCCIRFYSGEFNPPYILKLLKKYPITAFCGTPTLLSLMARFKRGEKTDSLKHICISGECMDSTLGKQLAAAFPAAKLYHLYGLTEASPRVSYLPPSLFERYPDCVGIPLPSVSIKILDKTGKEAAKGDIGFLWVKGPNIMAGYYNNPEKTSQVLRDGWLYTRDLASMNEAGLLKIHGRVDDLIIKGGMNIYPLEIENALKKDPRVYEVCVKGEKGTQSVTRIVMDIVGDFSTTAEVKALCQKLLPPYQVPDKINLLLEIPKNGSGKMSRT